MKLSKSSLSAIVATFRKGLMENKDISDLLRNLDFEVVGSEIVVDPTSAVSSNEDVWSDS